MPVRRAEATDFAEIAAIQARCPGAAQWDLSASDQYEIWISDRDGGVAGFLVARFLGVDEWELLNLAVAPEFRRRGIARELLTVLVSKASGPIWLEVRASNRAARDLYKSMGFQEISSRPKYYDSPPETAIVMKFHSC